MEERDLNQELKITKKYYEKVRLELSKIVLNNVTIEEKHTDKINENGEEEHTLEYGVYMEFKGEKVKVAIIDESGKLTPNTEILEDKKYSPEEVEALGDMLNRLGLEQEEVDINKLQQQLKEIEAKTEKEFKQKDLEKEKDEEESIKDEEKEQSEEEDEKDKEDAEKEEIAKKKHIPSKYIFILRPDSQFYKNYPQVPKTTYFYRDNDGKIKAEYIDENGQTKPSEFFNDSTTNLRENVVGLRDDGEPVKEEKPYQVMTTKGLTNTNRNARDIRIAVYIENGYMEFEETRLGTNGKWTGYGLEGKGRDYNSKVVNKMSNTNTNKVNPEDISDRYEEVENTGLADDGVQLEDLSPAKTIERFMEEGYNKEESIEIYNYMIGEEHLSEEIAKERVNNEIVEKIEKDERKVDDNEKTPWDDAWQRRQRR